MLLLLSDLQVEEIRVREQLPNEIFCQTDYLCLAQRTKWNAMWQTEYVPNGFQRWSKITSAYACSDGQWPSHGYESHHHHILYTAIPKTLSVKRRTVAACYAALHLKVALSDLGSLDDAVPMTRLAVSKSKHRSKTRSKELIGVSTKCLHHRTHNNAPWSSCPCACMHADAKISYSHCHQTPTTLLSSHVSSKDLAR